MGIMNTPLIFFVGVVVLGAVLVIFPAMQKAGAGRKPFSGVVEYVKDGDSLVIKGVRRDVRLWGIDAPEKGEAGADRARDAMSGLVRGKRVRVEPIAIDDYNRIVARVYLRGNQDVGRHMIERGHAREYCRFSKNYYGTCR